MSFRRVSRIALVVLAGALVACSADQSNPTAPDLGGLASLTGEMGKPDKPPKDDGGGQPSYFFDMIWEGDVNSIGMTRRTRSAEKLSSFAIGVFFTPSPDGLDLSFFANGGHNDFTDDDAAECFTIITRIVRANLGGVTKRDLTISKASHSFDAKGADGEPASYFLQMVGDVPWGLPGPNDAPKTFTFPTWELTNPNGGGFKNATACTGSGDFVIPVEVTVTNAGDGS